MTEGSDKTVEAQDGQQGLEAPAAAAVVAAASDNPEPAQINGVGEAPQEPTAAGPDGTAPEEQPTQQAEPEIPEGHGEVVLVTDAVSFIGAHVVSQLVRSGQFRVRAAVTDIDDEAKVKALMSLSSTEVNYPLEVVEAGSVAKPEAWDAALKDCEFVISATSLPSVTAQGANSEDPVKAAVDAAVCILKAAHAAKTVKRVVLTSSISAITQGHGDSKKKFTEEDWTEAEKAVDGQSKVDTLVEKAAWNFVKELPDNERFELVAINPGYVLGPSLVSPGENSAEVVRRLLNRNDPMLPKLNFNVVDVRDVALAHMRALTLPVAGARHILVSHNVWLRDIAVILSKEFKKQGFSVTTTQAPFFVLWVKAQFDPSIKSILPLVNHLHETDTKRMKEALYIQPRDLKETIIDTASSLIEQDAVKKAEKKPMRRFSLRRSKKEPKEEAKPTDAGTEVPAAPNDDCGKKIEKKKKIASPKKKSDKKKKAEQESDDAPAAAAAPDGDAVIQDAAAAETVAASTHEEAAPPAPEESAAAQQPEGEAAAGATEASEGPADEAAAAATATAASPGEEQQHSTKSNGIVCQVIEADDVPVPAEEVAIVLTPSEAPAVSPTAPQQPSGDQEEPAAVTAC